MSSVTILIPTLNEEANIDLLLGRILSVCESCEFTLDHRVLFVDSASADSTCERVQGWQDKGPVSLLRRETNVGLAGAVIAGAKHTDSEFLLVMDADLSHPPEDIPRLLGPLLKGAYDMVIGSRYVSGGGTPDWPLRRKISSKLATVPALLFCDVHDPLAGFIGLRRELITSLPVDVPGFKIGLAILAEYRHQLRVLEVPIQFRDRDFGQSKMGRAVIFDYLKQLVSISSRRLRGGG